MQNSKMKNRKYKEALYLCCLTVSILSTGAAIMATVKSGDANGY